MGAAKELITVEAEQLASSLIEKRAGERILHLYETYGERVVASTSFGLQAAIMLHLISEHAPRIPVIFVDTGYLFPETYQYIEKLRENLKIDLRIYQPRLTAAHQEALYGKLWEQGEEGIKQYGLINKVEPMNRAIKEIGGDIWISGLRRAQSGSRANRSFAEKQGNTIKAYPIIDWADAQVSSYFFKHNLPKHPLESKGFVTMGDWHSTQPLQDGMTAEQTRFNGNKYECGLHVNDYQI